MYIQVRNTDTLHARTHYYIVIISLESMYNLRIKSPCHDIVFPTPYVRKEDSRWMAHTITQRGTGSSRLVRFAIYKPQISRSVVEKVTIIQNPVVVYSYFRTKSSRVSGAAIAVGTSSIRRTELVLSML